MYVRILLIAENINMYYIVNLLKIDIKMWQLKLCQHLNKQY
jgi:hypothetical protein